MFKDDALTDLRNALRDTLLPIDQIPLWIAWSVALKSGNYHQGRYMMVDSKGGYCCLGVLCQLHGVNFIDFDDLETSNLEEFIDFGTSTCTLHPIATEIERSFANTNDSGATFAEIAEVIDEVIERSKKAAE